MINLPLYKVGDILQFKKGHPCGCDTWKVIKVGVDYKLECTGCKRVIIIQKSDIRKKVKKQIMEQAN
ncbi:MAG: DUF951 domain-containing protein [Bacilli bacterium]